MEASEGYVVLRVGAGRYALALADVGEIGRTPALTRLPGVATFLAGIANWRGSTLPVLDARRLLGAPASSPGRSLAIMRRGDVEAGLLVDGVEGVLDGAGSLGAVPSGVPPATAALLAGTLLDPAGSPVAVLDAGALLGLGRRA